MRIDEISPQEQMQLNTTKWESVAQLDKFLTSKGYKRIAAGIFSSVYTKKGDNSVIKVSKREDVCWLRFARWVMQQPENKHLPKIFSLRTYTSKDGEKLFVSRIEKLHEVQAGSDYLEAKILKEMNPAEYAEALWLASILYKHSENFPMFFDQWEDVVDRSKLRQEAPDMDTVEFMRAMLKKYANTGFSRLIRKAQQEILKDRKCFADLHTGNMMAREDGTLVLMDPAAMYWD